MDSWTAEPVDNINCSPARRPVCFGSFQSIVCGAEDCLDGKDVTGQWTKAEVDLERMGDFSLPAPDNRDSVSNVCPDAAVEMRR
jgi:hypothetical protein